MSEIMYKEFLLKEIFEPHQGNAIYTKKAIISNGWEGNVPVISSDTNNNGIMDGNELGRAAAINATTIGLNFVPVFGKALSDFAAKAAASESNNIAGQSDTSYGGSGTTYTSYTGPSQGPGSSTLTPLKEKVEPEKVNNNFIKMVKRLDISSLPAVTSTYIKRGEEKTPAITVSDEELKSFALRFYPSK